MVPAVTFKGWAHRAASFQLINNLCFLQWRNKHWCDKHSEVCPCALNSRVKCSGPKLSRRCSSGEQKEVLRTVGLENLNQQWRYIVIKERTDCRPYLMGFFLSSLFAYCTWMSSCFHPSDLQRGPRRGGVRPCHSASQLQRPHGVPLPQESVYIAQAVPKYWISREGI